MQIGGQKGADTKMLSGEETQFQNEILKILPEMYKNSFQNILM